MIDDRLVFVAGIDLTCGDVADFIRALRQCLLAEKTRRTTTPKAGWAFGRQRTDRITRAVQSLAYHKGRYLAVVPAGHVLALIALLAVGMLTVWATPALAGTAAEMTWQADVPRFTECLTGRSYPSLP